MSILAAASLASTPFLAEVLFYETFDTIDPTNGWVAGGTHAVFYDSVFGDGSLLITNNINNIEVNASTGHAFPTTNLVAVGDKIVLSLTLRTTNLLGGPNGRFAMGLYPWPTNGVPTPQPGGYAAAYFHTVHAPVCTNCFAKETGANSYTFRGTDIT